MIQHTLSSLPIWQYLSSRNVWYVRTHVRIYLSGPDDQPQHFSDRPFSVVDNVFREFRSLSDSHNILNEHSVDYNPSVPLAIVAGTLFTINGISLFANVFRHRHWWGLCLPIGSLCKSSSTTVQSLKGDDIDAVICVGYALGFFLRIAARNSPNSLGLFIIMQLFLVCSPATFLAFNYIVYGRLIEENVGAQYSLIRPSLVARIFVISDVVTFLIQVRRTRRVLCFVLI